MRIAVPTLRVVLCARGASASAARALLTDDTLAGAEADSEMAYRLATYFAVEGRFQRSIALAPPRNYLGNENYPGSRKIRPGTTSAPTPTSSGFSKT